ncbi:MAG: hypothetical protein HW416_2268 [Chloroflexi bacterium]|nr:hypothetical protein [Chloroflexota bacterium]
MHGFLQFVKDVIASDRPAGPSHLAWWCEYEWPFFYCTDPWWYEAELNRQSQLLDPTGPRVPAPSADPAEVCPRRESLPKDG